VLSILNEKRRGGNRAAAYVGLRDMPGRTRTYHPLRRTEGNGLWEDVLLFEGWIGQSF